MDKSLFKPIIMVTIVLGIYLVFFSSIETKPEDPGFWIVLALGIAIGVFVSKVSLKKPKN